MINPLVLHVFYRIFYVNIEIIDLDPRQGTPLRIDIHKSGSHSKQHRTKKRFLREVNQEVTRGVTPRGHANPPDASYRLIDVVQEQPEKNRK